MVVGGAPAVGVMVVMGLVVRRRRRVVASGGAAVVPVPVMDRIVVVGGEVLGCCSVRAGLYIGVVARRAVMGVGGGRVDYRRALGRVGVGEGVAATAGRDGRGRVVVGHCG